MGGRRQIRAVVAVLTAALLLTQVMMAPASAAARLSTAPPPGCTTATLAHGALSMFCIPASGWNGALVVWAHGYVAPGRPIDFYDLTLGTLSVPDLARALGFAFATTSYRQNGLAILEGVDDVAELIAAFQAATGRRPLRTYLIGVSEGGTIATLFAERRATLVDGVLAACGAIGSFKGEIDYVGDFRVLFDYFFPGILPGTPTQIPAELISNWEAVYAPRVSAALAADPLAMVQLMLTSHAAVTAGDLSTLANTTMFLLWYSVVSTNDAATKLGGNPYGNMGRWYSGSTDDVRLNLSVERVATSAAASVALMAYEASGLPGVPLVTLHTMVDPVIPFWHEFLYGLKSRGAVASLPVAAYGHCAFTVGEVMLAFGLLQQLTGVKLSATH